MFCSSVCYEKVLKSFKSNVKNIEKYLTDDDIKRKMSIILNESLRAFGNIAVLREHFNQTSVNNKTIFDFDWNGLNDEEMKRTIFDCNISLLPKSDSQIRKYLETTIQIPNIELRTFLVDFISRLILNYLRNGVKVPGEISTESAGGMLLPFVSLLNHSCDPNIYVSFIENQAIVTVIRPIKANEQVFNNYR
jgi:hypothetical protein